MNNINCASCGRKVWAKFIKFSPAELARLWRPQTVLVRKFNKLSPN